VRLPQDLLALVDEKRDRRSMTEFVERALRAAMSEAKPGEEMDPSERRAMYERVAEGEQANGATWVPAPDSKFAGLLVPHRERLLMASLRVDRELRWLSEEPVEGRVTVSSEKLIPHHPEPSRYLSHAPFYDTAERLARERSALDVELAALEAE
jgi:hypothetical protein